MIRAVDIQEKLMHLVGWEQSYDTTDFRIADSLTQSESGLYFQQAHPLLTLENIQCIAPDFKNITYPEYSAETQYSAGNVVSSEGTLYKALKDSVDQPVSNTDYWEQTNPFSDWLEKKTKSSIQKAISRFVNDKLAKSTTKDLFENKTLFDGTGRITDTVKNKQNFVGFEIVPIRSAGVTTKINKIGLQFTEPGAYTIYIMHSSSYEPVYTLTFNKTRKNSVEWFELKDLYLPYESDKNDAGGSWYICYSQSELPAGSMAIRKNRDWSKGPCNACSRREYESWVVWSKYIEVHPFYVNEELVDRPEQPDEPPLYLWDIDNNQYTYDTNYGLNLEISMSCDLTEFIIKQRHLFQDIILKQLAIDMLREFAYNANVRTNRHSINASRVDILYEIDGDSSSMKQSGLSYQLEKAFKAVELSTEGLDRVCQPCVNHGIKYRTV